jgi:hypothetical protein
MFIPLLKLKAQPITITTVHSGIPTLVDIIPTETIHADSL